MYKSDTKKRNSFTLDSIFLSGTEKLRQFVFLSSIFAIFSNVSELVFEHVFAHTQYSCAYVLFLGVYW